jgi:hypothetical protein
LVLLSTVTPVPKRVSANGPLTTPLSVVSVPLPPMLASADRITLPDSDAVPVVLTSAP